ncbi:MAG: DUF3014 domain-containing protein [Woeseiaceae bacterium]
MKKDNLQWLVPVVLALGVAVALWFYWSRSHSPTQRIEQPVAAPEQAPADEAPAQPAHPLPDAGAAAGDKPALRPLPPLDRSDEYFELALTDLFGDPIGERLADSRLIERIVATIDNLPREQVAERIRPLGSVPGQFAVEGEEGDDKFVLNPENYRRYDNLVGMIAQTDTPDMVELYKRFYPLFQKAYADLGYPDGYFNDRLVEVIDHLLATPQVDEPIPLVRPHVLYEFADPELEKLSSGQKALLRIGGENAAVVKEKLREFRQQIVIQGDARTEQ